MESQQGPDESIIKEYLNNNRDLMKFQRDYKNILNTKLLNRKETVFQRSLQNNLEYTDNDLLKNEISVLKKQLLTVDKEIDELKTKTLSVQVDESKIQKNLNIVQNQLEVLKIRESKYFAENERYRNQIIDMLYNRALFNKYWKKILSRLNHDKKYLIDLIENAMQSFDGAIDIYTKFNSVHKKEAREMELRKQEMQGILQKITQNQNKHAFFMCKAKSRNLDDLEPREYKRRHIVRKIHQNKKHIYEKVLERVLSFSGVESIDQVIENFKKQQSLYNSYINYANGLTYNMSNLNSYIEELRKNIINFNDCNVKRLSEQQQIIKVLKLRLQNEKQKTSEKYEKRKNMETKLENLFSNFYTIFNLMKCDPSPMALILGDHSNITIYNVKTFLKILETRINNVLAYLYLTKKGKNVIVKGITREYTEPTPLDDIIPVNQCPECAENEDFNITYGAKIVKPIDEAKAIQKLIEKVPQPEMQLRLHNLSQCKLPRSKMLANKKY
ncbi:uncharacterized protein LOC129605838 [Condylostylus longicornis]|uniref:uncharacterized protein LOC129605838 n=1 Tax=Condylostylus longicornis TaxID=2530218 RepID=UPI00244E3D8B|nr:uncharacterized protein LOC129605838 [Condylostylus longicornis]